jgi:D-glycero-alpha-D-manno-heptose-7-phosphate kinase
MVGKRQLALDAIHIEQELLKENVGSQDQAAAAFGGLNRIEFGGPHAIAVQPVTLSAERYRNLQDHLMLFFTGVSRNASEIAAEQIRNTPAKASELKRMGHMVDEAVAILKDERPLDDFGKLLDEAWQIKRGLSSQVSNAFIDGIYASARTAGALGGKLLGAGGGGFILFFVQPELQARVRERLKHLLHVPFRFESLGSQVIYYAPEQAASVQSA